MSSHILSADTQAIMLLCGRFGESVETAKPFSTTELNEFTVWLDGIGFPLSDILDIDEIVFSELLKGSGYDVARITALLSRGSALAFAVEQWTNVGLWVIGRNDERYPSRLKLRLAKSTPPILYGIGNQHVLEEGGVAIVGSRDADEGALSYTRKLATLCARQKLSVISGGARGIDSEAMLCALENGGSVLGILADGLGKQMVTGNFRSWVEGGMLTLLSPFHPRAVFNVGGAMERNKLIYTLSDYAVVSSSDVRKGGTWQGAIENMKHRWVPIFVRNGADVPEGNRELIKRGAAPLDEESISISDSLKEWFEERQQAKDSGSPSQGKNATARTSEQQSLL